MNKIKFFLVCFLATLMACSSQPSTQSNSVEEVQSLDKEPTSKDIAPDTDQIVPTASSETITETDQSQETGPIVYVTEDGDKYHTADCRYSKTAHSISLAIAKSQGKTACGICKPSSTTGQKQARCTGTTAEGKKCQRLTSDASGRCFQHREG
ncbi:MAG: hypothetical protein R2820_13985 [Cyclobacteriaceae bacterium]|nr:hypothetical protein [Cyclobacteriaceae bacterium]